MVLSEFLLLLPPDDGCGGGGDLSLGLMGQEGVPLSLGVWDGLAGLGTRDACSEEVGAAVGWSVGVVAAERARWMAAAEGTLEV